MSKKKPNGYWKNLDNILNESKKIKGEYKLDHLPGRHKMYELGYSGLANAISDYPGGFRYIRQKLGEKQLRVEYRLLKDKKYVIKEVKKVMKKYKLILLPTGGEFNKLGYSSLSYAIGRYHGGFYEFRKLLGEEQKIVKRVKNNSWKSLDFTVRYAKKLIKKHKLKSLPSHRGLINLERDYSLSWAIKEYHGGFHKFRKILGEGKKIMEKGKWKDTVFTEKEAIRFMEEYGYTILPSQKVLYSKGRVGLAMAIKKYHGGFPTFREKLREHLGQPSEKDQLENMLKDYVGGEK